MEILDIGGKSENMIARKLSNMSNHEFNFRGFRVRSAECILQSVKYKNPYLQLYALSLIGMNSKREGTKYDWKEEQKLYWFGHIMDRNGEEYQKFIDELYISLLKNEDFKNNLLSSSTFRLIHSIGKQNPCETVLTEHEFVGRLTKIRGFLKENKDYIEKELIQYLETFHKEYLDYKNCLYTLRQCAANKDS